MSRRGKNVFYTPPAKRGHAHSAGDGAPPPDGDLTPPPPKRTVAFSIGYDGKCTPIDKAPPRRHWSRSPGIGAATGEIFKTWEEAHAAADHNKDRE